MIETEGEELTNESILSSFRSWLDPFGTFHSGLIDAILLEQGRVAAIAEDGIGKWLHVRPSSAQGIYARSQAADTALNSFQVVIGTGLNARLGLILRMLFDREEKGRRTWIVTTQHSEQAARMYAGRLRPRSTSKRDAKLHKCYASLVGLDEEEPITSLQWWIEKVHLGEASESYESRNGFRYGHLFILFHEFAHIHRQHLEGQERASVAADPPDQILLQLGFECDADRCALFNLLVYIECMVEMEATQIYGELAESNRRKRGLYVFTSRASHFRAAFFGIFAVFSCFNPLRWTNLEFNREPYLQATTRLGLAVKSLDWMGFPTGGRLLFSCFDWFSNIDKVQGAIEDNPYLNLFGPSREPQWNWSEFFMAAIYDWDMEIATFLSDMSVRQGLPISPIPFAVNRSGLEYVEETFLRFQTAHVVAKPYIANDRNLFMSSEHYKVHFRDMYGQE